jgi:cell division septation protein DedD
MTNKDFREIQVSSTLLVVIFLGVLALGVFIFLLGVSVGKKQAVVAAPTQIVTQQIPEPVKEPPVKPSGSDTAAGDMTSAASGAAGQPGSTQAPPAASVAPSKPQPKETTVDPAVKAPETKSGTEAKKAPAAAPAGSGLYYVQLAAFTDRAQAQTFADKYKKQGYTTTISPRATSTKTWYRVRLGGYKARDQAVDLLNKLNAAAGKKTDYQIVHD